MRGIVRFAIFVILVGIAGNAFSGFSSLQPHLEKWMSEEFPLQNGRWKIHILEVNKTIDYEKMTSFNVNSIVGEKKPKKIMIFKTVSAVGDTMINCRITARVSKSMNVLVANKVILKGVTLTENEWRIEERMSESLTNDAIEDENEIMNKRTKKVISINEVLTRHAMETIPDVGKGKSITLRVVGAGIVLSTDAVSLQEGYIKDWIECKQIHSGQVVKAIIISDHEALIQLMGRN